MGEEAVGAPPVWREAVSTAWGRRDSGLGAPREGPGPPGGLASLTSSSPALGLRSATLLRGLRLEAAPQNDAPPLAVTRPAPGACLWPSLAGLLERKGRRCEHLTTPASRWSQVPALRSHWLVAWSGKGGVAPGWSHVVPRLGLSVSGGPSTWIEEWLRSRDGRAEMRGDTLVLMGVFSPLHLERKSVHGGGGGGGASA